MLMTAIDSVEFAPDYPDLAGKRVLLTGLTGSLGVELARAFAEHRCRLILQSFEEGPEIMATAELAAQSAMDVRLFTGPLTASDAMVRFARDAVQSYGGVDCVVNLAAVPETSSAATEAEVETAVTDLLALPVLTSKVAANRMRTTLAEGTILNIVADTQRATPRAKAIGAIARSALATLTRNEAKVWAPAGIRLNAVAPADRFGSRDCLTGAPDIASLSLHLSSDKGSRLSGLVFEAYCS